MRLKRATESVETKKVFPFTPRGGAQIDFARIKLAITFQMGKKRSLECDGSY